MRFFILDDDINVIRVLNKIIEDRDLGIVIGQSTNAQEGIDKIKAIVPDIVLIDLLMPKIDGLSIIKELKSEIPSIEFIMISQVSSKDMVEKAYKYGVEYYIYKPINAIEVETIIKKVINYIEINRSISKIQNILSDKREKGKHEFKDEHMQCIHNALAELGILGEKGSEDIINITMYIMNNNINLSSVTIKQLCKKFTNNPKSMEQRMRRAIGKAMTNIASLGIEDYMNEIFIKYSNTLFDFGQVRMEMERLRGKKEKGGSVNTRKFIATLVQMCENFDY